MPTTDRTLSTAEQRRAIVVSSAVTAFARGGLRSTTIAEVAAEAGISPAYVSKLFTSKEKLFVAAYGECTERVLAALDNGAAQAAGSAPDDLLHAMGGAYATLVADRDLLMLQVHAQAATEQPAVADAVRAGIARVTDFVRHRSGADDRSVQQFIAFGQLCHLLTTIDAFEVDDPWALALTAGIRHVDTQDEARTPPPT